MASKVDWKQKYYELRSKYMQAIDVSFRLGFQEGQKASEVQNLQTQLQEAQQMSMMGDNQQALPPGQGEEVLSPEEAMATADSDLEEESMSSEQGDELDSSIEELQGLVEKNEQIFDFKNVMKKFHEISSENTLQKDESKMKKKNKIASIIKKWEDDEDSQDFSEEFSNESETAQDY